MHDEAIIWTEGKTDWQHLKRAYQCLRPDSKVTFQDIREDMGDDQLLKQCEALSRIKQSLPTIFIFDRDKDDIVRKVDDSSQGYKPWGNNVYSFAIPVPSHRKEQSGICIELCYTDAELATEDKFGRRLFLSSEFNPGSGRHLRHSSLSIGQKGKLQVPQRNTIRIIDSDVYDEQHQNVALAKADFAKNVLESVGPFAEFGFEGFRPILEVIERILEQAQATVDLAFGDFAGFQESLALLDKPHQLSSVVEAAVRICILVSMLFVAATVRYYDPATAAEANIDDKRLRPIRRALSDSFTNPSLTTVQKIARNCYHVIKDSAPDALRTLQTVMAENPTLGPIGSLLDDLERVLPPDPRRGRILNKQRSKKPVLEYLIPELAKYEGRIAEIAEAASANDSLERCDLASWLAALSMLIDLFAPVRSLTFRVGTIERVRSDSDQFDVLLTTYQSQRAVAETVVREYQELTQDKLETYELLLGAGEVKDSLDLSPFFLIRQDHLFYYQRTRAVGYEYWAVFGGSRHVVPTKRKFSHSALGSTIAADRQMLFWAPVAPTISAANVKANIPAHDPNAFIGRTQQITKVMEEVVQIPNQNGILYGPGGVGKTALLIELSRRLFEGEYPEPVPFKNIIWISAKRDYYDPTLDGVEEGAPQFGSLDNILTAILEFHECEDADEYDLDDKKLLVSEFLREQKTLLILDNFETVRHGGQEEIVRFLGVEVKRSLMDRPDYFKVLLTSRELIPSGFHQIRLKGLDKRESKLLMQSLDEPYQHSGQQRLTEEQRDSLYEATQGIPLIVKHCYGQIFEYNRPVDQVLRNLSNAGNKVVDFSFAEIFVLLKEDPLQLKILLLLELMSRPLLLRQMADILAEEETDVARRITGLVNFQCVTRSSVGNDEKYRINDDVHMFTTRLTQEYSALATEIRQQVAHLAIEKRMDYTRDEFDALVVFQAYLAQRQYVRAEDFIKDKLTVYPDSILLNLHYAKHLKEVRRDAVEAIRRLEDIRLRSGNDPQILRLLMTYYISLETPDFAAAHSYASELESMASYDLAIRLEVARFYTEWSTATKLQKLELDPLKEMLRRQKYKELADAALKLLKFPECNTAECYYLQARCQYNKWDYDAALRFVNQALKSLPRDSSLLGPYERLKDEILKKWNRFASHG